MRTRARRDPPIDWRPAALVGVGAASLLLLGLVLAQPLLRSLFDRPLPSRPPAERPPEVDLWVGELAPGVKGLLSSVWNDPGTDAQNDAWWNERLGLREADRLAYYQLVMVNTSPEAARIALGDGVLSITPKGGDALRMRSLASVLTETAPSPALVRSLAAVGSSKGAIDLPPGTMATPYVAFPRRIGLGDAVSVARLDGTPFRRRRIPRERWEGIRAKPDADDLEDL